MESKSKSASTTSSETRTNWAKGISVQAPAPRTRIAGEVPEGRRWRASVIKVEHCSRCWGLCWRSKARRCTPCVCALLDGSESIRTAITYQYSWGGAFVGRQPRPHDDHPSEKLDPAIRLQDAVRPPDRSQEIYSLIL